MKCNHVFRSGPLLPERFGHQIGGVSIGECQNEVIPQLVVCHEHADKETLLLLVRMLQKDAEEMATVIVKRGKAGAVEKIASRYLKKK